MKPRGKAGGGDGERSEGGTAEDRPALDIDIREEIEFHLAMRARENEARGMPPEAARLAAERRFGDRARTEEALSRLNAGGMGGRGPSWMGGGWGDVRLALRGLRRRPGFSLAVVLTLALGIGATTAIYSVANWTLLRPVPGVTGAERMATVRFESNRRSGAFWPASHPDFLDIQRRVDAFSSVGAAYSTNAHVVLAEGLAPRRMEAALVTADYFRALGVAMALGRPPVASGEQGADIVVVSYHLWREAFVGRSRDILGGTISVNGRDVTVVGVAAEGFNGPEFPASAVDLWAPVEAHELLAPTYPKDVLAQRSSGFYFGVYGRLRDGATFEQVRAQLDAAGAALAAEYGKETALERLRPTVTPGVGLAPWMRDRLASMLRILAAVVAALLALACVNAANLLLARALTRGEEFRVRLAIGAARRHLVRQLTVEGGVLGLVAGGVGLLVALGILRLFRDERLVTFVRDMEPVRMDQQVLWFTLLVSIGVSIAFALVPAVYVGRDAQRRLHPGHHQDPHRSHVRSGLLVVQVALSLTLVVGAGLLVDTVRALSAVDLGFDPDPVVEVTVDPGTQGYDADRIVAYWHTLLEHAHAVPGVQSAGLVYAPLHGGIGSDTAVLPEGGDIESPIDTHSNYVSDGVLRTLGMRLVAGRDFRRDEVLDAHGMVAIVSEGLARDLFGVTSVLGRRLANVWAPEQTYEIVGVTAEVHAHSPKDTETHLVLLPFGDAWMPTWATLYVRSASDSQSTTRTLQVMQRDIDPALPLYDVQPMRRRVEAGIAQERVVARVSMLFTTVALLLAGLGLYGAMSGMVASRTREMGVRLALGARPGSLRALVLRHGLRTTLAGIAVGLGLALLLARVLEARLWGVSPFDPLVFATAAATLVGVAILACWLPAWRATRLDPVRSLRSE